MEPERPIEKLLSAYAKKRSDEAGAPFDLHPATRRLLQGEVARKFAKEKRQPGSLLGSLAMLWPRFMWGLGMLAVLVVVFAMVLPLWNKDQSKSLLAKHEPVAEELGARAAPQSAAAPATTPAQTAAPATDSVLTLNLADKDVLEARPPQPEPAKTHFFTANEPAAAPEPNTAPKNLEAPKLAGNATRIPAPEVARAESETFRQRAGEVRTQAALKEQAPPKLASPKD